MTGLVVNSCRIVLPDRVLEDASIRVEDGLVAEIVQGRSLGSGLDARGAWLLPGFVDVHADAIEKAVEPRPNARFPTGIAVRELDRSLAAWGVTTIFHSLSFAEMEIGLRSNAAAAALIDEIHGMRGILRVDTRIHARFEVTDLGALEPLERLLAQGRIGLLSFMDHSPGRGQYRDEAAYKAYYGKVYAKSDAELEGILARKRDSNAEDVDAAVAILSDLCRTLSVPMASHDDDTVARIAWCAREGVAMSEFPVNLETALAAREENLPTCLGAPNIVRGASQAGNLSARAAIAAGCGDILCSDYSPQAILHAIFLLHASGLKPLQEAVAMASLTPAKAVGLAEITGSVEVGKNADLLLVEERHGLPDILRTWSRGREIYSSY